MLAEDVTGDNALVVTPPAVIAETAIVARVGGRAAGEGLRVRG
jgi:hypothetical protein